MLATRRRNLARASPGEALELTAAAGPSHAGTRHCQTEFGRRPGPGLPGPVTVAGPGPARGSASDSGSWPRHEVTRACTTERSAPARKFRVGNSEFRVQSALTMTRTGVVTVTAAPGGTVRLLRLSLGLRLAPGRRHCDRRPGVRQGYSRGGLAQWPGSQVASHGDIISGHWLYYVPRPLSALSFARSRFPRNGKRFALCTSTKSC